MNKHLIKLLQTFIDKSRNNPRKSLNCVSVDFYNNTIVATDRYSIIKMHIPTKSISSCEGRFLINSKILKVAENMMSKDKEYHFERNFIIIDDNKISVDNIIDNKKTEWKFPETDLVFSNKYDYSFELKNLNQLNFELARCDVFIDNYYLKNIAEVSNLYNFNIEYNKQDSTHDISTMKITAYLNNKIQFEAIYMGTLFTPSLDNQIP